MLPLLVATTGAEEAEHRNGSEDDDRLRLIFICCHPALSREAQVALTLRLLCGLSTTEVARVFLVSEPTMAARLTRAKRKIADAHIPFRVPPRERLPERLESVLTVIYLLFSSGHTATVGDALFRTDLLDRALALAELLHELLPEEPHATALLALVLLTDARREARLGARGELILLEDQDRDRWDRAMIDRGRALVREALESGCFGRFALMAAIAAVHAEAPTWELTDWAEILGLYDLLARAWPSPIVLLNRAVARGLAEGPEIGLAALDALAEEPTLATYSYLASARAEMLRRMGRLAESREAFTEALMLTANGVERTFLEGRIAATMR